MSLCLLLRVKICGGQVINGVLGQVHLLLGTLCPQDHPVVISPFPECILEKTYLATARIPHHLSYHSSPHSMGKGDNMWNSGSC